MSAALDELLAGVDMAPRRKRLLLPNGNEFVFFASPVTLDEREMARKEAKKDDATTFALTLLVLKAQDSTGRKRFTLADLPGIKRLMPASVAEQVLELLVDDESYEDDIDVLDDAAAPAESARAATPKRSPKLSAVTVS